MEDMQQCQAEVMTEGTTCFRDPPRLSGYTFSGPRAYAARDNNQLLTLWLETSGICNLRCSYCERGRDRKEADVALLRGVITQAKSMGCRSVVFSGYNGEPLMFSGLRELVGFVDSLQMIPVVFTNAVFAFKDIAEFLYEHNASVVIKCDSFRSEIQDELAGRAGASILMRQGLENLIDAGFIAAGDALRLGAVFTVTGRNVQETADFWHFCRRNRIYPLVGMMGEAEVRVSVREISRIKTGLHEIDRKEYGYEWNVFSPIPGSTCMQYLAGMYITLEGDARPCPRTRLEEHAHFRKGGIYPLNVTRKSLEEIYYSGPMYYCRHIDSFLGGKCRECVNIDQCVGCRGCAYISGIGSGMGPLHALASECRYCHK